MKLILPLVALSLFATNAFAQHANQDYLLTTQGDTLFGRLQRAGKQPGAVKLYRPGMASAQFGPAETQGYGSRGRPIRVSKVVGPGGLPKLLVPLVAGYVNLYYGENEQQEKRFYLQGPGATYVTELERATSQLTLARTLPGCPALDFGTESFQRTYPYSATGLSKLVMAYNACREPAQRSSVVNRSTGLHISLRLKAGINVSEFNLSAPAYSGFGPQRESPSYQAGVSVNFSGLNKFSVQVEANFLAMRGSYGPYEAYYATLGVPGNTHTTRIHYDQLQVPLLFGYEFGNGTFRPFLHAGPSVGLNFSNSSADTYFAPPTSIPSHAVNLEVEVGKTAVGVAGGGGISLHRAGLPVLNLEVRYDQVAEGIAHNDYALHLLRHNSLRFEAGISF